MFKYRNILDFQTNISVTEFKGIFDAEEKNREYHIFSDELRQIQHDAVKVGGRIDKNEARLKHIETKLENIELDIRKYYEDEEKIKQNNKFNEQIRKYTDIISRLQMESIDIDKTNSNINPWQYHFIFGVPF